MSKHKHLYNSARWGRLRDQQLKDQPLCQYCLAKGNITLATVVDHILPHRGNRNLFYAGKLQSLCAAHHSGSKQSEELRGYALEVGTDGIPLDPDHPVNRTMR